MYSKPIEIPCHIEQYGACLRRLALGHPARGEIEGRFKRAMAGYRGEKSLTFFLDYLPCDEFFIFHNLRLFDGTYHFQIDWLMLCPRFFLILEAKNIAGRLEFDHGSWQMIRELDGKIDVFDDPILQAERLSTQLEQWIGKRLGYCRIPIENRIVITSAARMHMGGKDAAAHQIIRKAYLGKELNKLNRSHSKIFLQMNDLRKMTDLLLGNHSPLVINPFTSIKNLHLQDIIRGVPCPNCRTFCMKRAHRSWYCETCGHTSKNAHVPALRDYCLLFGPKITNGQCRQFLLLDSPKTAQRILHKVTSHSEGEHRGRTYDLSFERLPANCE